MMAQKKRYIHLSLSKAFLLIFVLTSCTGESSVIKSPTPSETGTEEFTVQFGLSETIAPPSPSPTPESTSIPTPLEGLLVFSSDNSLYALDLASNEVRVLAPEGFSSDPVFDPTANVYFLRQDDHYLREIYRINFDGSGFEPVTANNYDVIWMAPSPDGRTIAYVARQYPDDANYYFQIMRLNNASLISSIPSPEIFWLPAWSPDGKRIAFIHPHRQNNPYSDTVSGDLYLVDENGNNMTQITEDLPIFPGGFSWSPDSTSILVAAYDDPGRNLYSVDVNSQEITRLTNSPEIATEPIWSPDGEHMLFWSDNRLCYLESDLLVERCIGDRDISINKDSLVYWPVLRQSVWSPAGDKIAYALHVSRDEEYLMIYDLATGAISRLCSDRTFGMISSLSWVVDPTH
jgi:Tol biopolymer transport system component